MPPEEPAVAIYTDIGRGHPSYLDSVLLSLKWHHKPVYRRIAQTNVFEISRGLSLTGWRAVRSAYRLGSRGGFISSIYSRFRSSRSEFDPKSAVVRILQRDLLEYLSGYKGICIVAHPLVANMLKKEHRVFYVHGEIAAPPESAVRDIERVYVPLGATAEKMRSYGVDPEYIVKTGLVLEPMILNDLSGVIFDRQVRLDSRDAKPAVGFAISGAYPREHVRFMTESAIALLEYGCKVRFFWGSNTVEANRLQLHLIKAGFEPVITSVPYEPVQFDPAVIVTGRREIETTISTKYIPQLDLLVAAPHERTNWAVGAGLPIAALTPTIGSFAPENLAFILERGCGFAVSTRDPADKLVSQIVRYTKSGKIIDMVRSGTTMKNIKGAKRIADDIAQKLQAET